MTQGRLAVVVGSLAVTSAALLGCGAKKEGAAKTGPGSAAAAGSGAATATATAAGSGSGSAPTAGSGATPAAGSGSAPAAAPATGSGSGPGAAALSANRTKGPMPAAYRDALHTGRKLAAAGQWPKAADSFRAALAAVPDDPRALSELSWALFQAKDPGARAVAEQAVKVGRNNVKAASLYNLGRILEAAGDAPGAANAYRESIVMRPNKTVAQHLAKVDPAARPAADLLEIEEWGPPDAARPSTCDALGDDGEGYAEWSPDGACKVTATDVAITGEPGPFQQVTQLVRTRSGSDEAFIAVKTADGWLMSPPFLSWGGVGTWGATASITRAEASVHPVLGPVLRVDVKTLESGRWENWETESTVFCAASRPGGSGALTCTPLYPTSWLHSEDDEDAVDETCAATIALEPDGAISITSRTARSPVDCPIHLGRFTWPPSR